LIELTPLDSLSQQLFELLPIERGHFRFESGHHGDTWLGLDAFFQRPAAIHPLVVALAERLAKYRVDTVCGPAVGGAVLAQLVAVQLSAKSIVTERLSTPDGMRPRYQLPPSLQFLVRGKRVAVVDDAINAGSAVGSTLAEIRAAGGEPVAVGALLILGNTFELGEAAQDMPIECLTRLPIQLWGPSDCPFCKAGVRLESPTIHNQTTADSARSTQNRL
jgi:orotate phosphoribosyltransferase